MNFRVKAAGFVLSNSNIEEALELLESANSKSSTIPDEVSVCEKFQFDPTENIIEHIDELEEMLKDVYNKGVNSVTHFKN